MTMIDQLLELPENASATQLPVAYWIWSDLRDPAPENRFTYFRKTFVLEELPKDPTLRFAASSNAQLWINGRPLRRKVTRYHEERITAERVQAASCLRQGVNVILVLHHNWGAIQTFQRTGNRQACLWLEAPWLASDASWRWQTAPQFLPHRDQIRGINEGAYRIRYPQIIDGRNGLAGDPHDPAYDDQNWAQVAELDGPEWSRPEAVETPGQREYPVSPCSVLGAGKLQRSAPPSVTEAPLSIAARIGAVRLAPSRALKQKAQALIVGKPLELRGKAGESKYLTFDFAMPVHGFPYLALAQADAGIIIDFGYGEIPYSLYDGKAYVTPDGWINAEGLVGQGYADRYITTGGAQQVELPDERTARWLTLHIHFQSAGRLRIAKTGIVRSQYPIQPLGSFECGDARIDQIVKLCRIHAEVTMTDSYVDTPSREDGQWIEDAKPRAELAARWFGDHQLRRLMIRTHAEGQYPCGNFHPFAPSNYPYSPGGPYDWSVQWVGCLYQDYGWTGQTDLIRRYWQNLCSFWRLALSHVTGDGLWRTSNVLADLRIGLHTENDRQSSGVVTPSMIVRLRNSVEMAEAIGERTQAECWRGEAERMAAAFKQYHIVSDDGAVPAHVGDVCGPENPALERGYSQAAQVQALFHGLVDPETALRDIDHAFAEPDGSPTPGVDRWNNPTWFYRVLRLLSAFGRSKRAVAHLIERCEPYLPHHPRNPAPLALHGPYGGPLPEYWLSREDLKLKAGEPNPAQPNDPTGSHGWNATPLLWMHEWLLGVRLLTPGGESILIAPDDGGLPYVAGHTVTPKGVVFVCWDPGQWLLEIHLPAGVTAKVQRPASVGNGRFQTLLAEGRVLAEHEESLTLNGAGRYLLTLFGHDTLLSQ